MSQKLTRKQVLQNLALEKRKYKRRLEKSNPSTPITDDVVKEQISISHIDRIQGMLPPGIKNYRQYPQPKRNKINPRFLLPYKSLKKFVYWLPLRQQDADTPASLTQEIEEFAKYVSLDQSEIDSRENMVREINETILSKWNFAIIHQFGSYNVGLSTFMSDLDISILNVGLDLDLPGLEPPPKHDNNIIQTVVKGGSGLAHLQTSTAKVSSTAQVISLLDHYEAEVIDLTTPDKISSSSSSMNQKEQVDPEEEYDSDQKYSKYNVQTTAAKTSTNNSSSTTKSAGQFVDLVSVSSDESDSEVDDNEVTWKIDTTGGESSAVITKKNNEEDATATVGLVGETVLFNVNPSDVDEEEDWESSDDSHDSKYETLPADNLNNDDDEDIEELNRLYEAEERQLADIDDDELDSLDSQLEREEENLMEQVGKKRRRRDSGDDDSYYSDGDVYSRHKQNELFKTIKTKIESSDNVAEEDSDVKVVEVCSENIEDSSSSESEGNDSLTKLMLLNQGSDSDEESIDWNGGDEEDGENDDIEHSLIIGASDYTKTATASNGGVPSSVSTARVSSSSSAGVVDKEAELARHKKILSLLRTLFPHIKSMNWLSKIELRSRARVPIINLQHKNSIECDISVGVSAQDTSHIVQQLKEFCGPALFSLSCFLKVFLNQFDLDKPFSGGLGSYKLYVIIAAHVQKNQQFVANKTKPDLGSLLLSFLKYFGNPRHLNQGTTIAVLNAEVCFDRTNRVHELQKLFEVAHEVLYKIIEKRRLHVPSTSSSTTSDAVSSSAKRNQALIINEGNYQTAVPTVNVNHQISSSALACLLDVEQLCVIRAQFRQKCREYPLVPEADLDAMAQQIVNDLERRLSFPKGVTVDSIKKINPCLYARLRSFPSVEAAVRHLGSRDASFVPPNPASGPYQRMQQRNDSNKSLSSSGGNSSFPRSKNNFNNNREGEFKFTFNGVVGNSITDLPSATNKRVMSNGKYKQSKETQQQHQLPSRHSFGGFASSSNSVVGNKRQHLQNIQQFDGFSEQDFKKPKYDNDRKKKNEVVPVVRYNNPKSGFTFANQNYNNAPAAASNNNNNNNNNNNVSLKVSSNTSSVVPTKVNIAVAAKNLSQRIGDTITDLKKNIEKVRSLDGNSKKQKINKG